MHRIRQAVVVLWLTLLTAALYLYFFDPVTLKALLTDLLARPKTLAAAIYLAISCVRGFTLIPATYFIVAGIPILPPTPLFLLSVVGILVSSASIYLFSEAMKLDEYIERNHKEGVQKVKDAMQRHEMPIIIGWSFFPLVPTDVICYVCGTLKVNFKKFLLGILIGEGSICAIYIFLGDNLMRLLSLRP
jgi:uncharacterized membrane protein YdjX (TVP38/TMEM64 family)